MGEILEGLLTFAVLGLVTGAAYAIASSGLVITYATSNVFNMAHGAVGMVMAFVYWQFTDWNVPPFLSLLVVVGVVAPAFGALLERTMMRRLTDASVTVSLTVTVGLFVLLLGGAQLIWKPGVARSVEPFLPGRGVTMLGVFVTAHQIITFVLAGLVAVGLYYLLNRTRTGIGMRAIVDNRTLLALHGARPELLGMLSWAIGSSLAALAGILLVATVGLDYLTLTLIVINAFAAAMLGKLTSLPRTFIGALILGQLIEQFNFLLSRLPDSVTSNQVVSDLLLGVRGALPTLFLFAAMLAIPQERLRVGRVEGATLVRLPSRRRTVASAVGLVAAVALVVVPLSEGNVSSLGRSLAIAAVMLSLVLLAGYGGDMSLGQLTFAGFGGLTVVKWLPAVADAVGLGALFPPGQVSIRSLLAAAIVAMALGAIVALPALRLRGLYLGLGTLAFAAAMDEVVFRNATWGFELGGSATIERPEFLGLSFEGERAAAIFVALVFALLAVLVIEIRRSRFGRRLLASRDSPAACGTLGLSITRTRVAVFSVAAGIAGIGGVLLATMQVAIGPQDFQMIQNLPLLLLAVVGGITSVSGAALGGLLLGLSPAVTNALPELGGLLQLLIGVAAVLLGRNPNGLAGAAFAAARRVLGTRQAPPGAVVVEDDRVEEVAILGAP